jgi:hypothetical protein
MSHYYTLVYVVLFRGTHIVYRGNKRSKESFVISGIQEKYYGEMKSFIERNTWLCEQT